MVKKILANLDSSKTPGPECIPVVVLKNCQLELSYILAELLCQEESYFPGCWNVSSVVPVFEVACMVNIKLFFYGLIFLLFDKTT